MNPFNVTDLASPPILTFFPCKRAWFLTIKLALLIQPRRDLSKKPIPTMPFRANTFALVSRDDYFDNLKIERSAEEVVQDDR
jgi:hypothetical protein